MIYAVFVGKSFQAAKASVQLPINVNQACNVTKPLRDSALSNKCHVHAAMALTRAGSMASAIPFKPRRCIKTIASDHSITDATWIHQVPRDKECIAAL